MEGNVFESPRAWNTLKVSKYLFMEFTSCPKKFQYLNLLGVPRVQSPSAELGEDFHDFASKFFTIVDLDSAKKARSLEEVARIFAQTVDLEEGELREYCLKFAYFEAEHFDKLRKVLPKDYKRYFFPLDIELYIETKTTAIRADRIDLLVNNESCMFEYKVSGSWNPTLLRRELVFNSILAKSVKKFKYVHPVTHIACYNPLLDNFMFEKISKKTTASVVEHMRRWEESMKTGNFPRNPSGLCSYCEAAERCYS